MKFTVITILSRIVHRCEAILGEFLREIKKSPDNVNFADMVNIIVVHSTSNGKERVGTLRQTKGRDLESQKSVNLKGERRLLWWLPGAESNLIYSGI